MKNAFLTILIFWAAGFDSSVFAQTAPQTKRAPKFSSVYTDLRRDCKDALNGRDRQSSLARGQDIPQRCKGFGGYYVSISYSAVEAYLHAVKAGDEDVSILLRPKYSDFIVHAGSKIEWRIADGKPFAVILRFENYRSDDADSGPFEAKNKRGETLLVKGLDGFEKVEFELDAKTPNINQRARDLADAAYRQNFVKESGEKL